MKKDKQMVIEIDGDYIEVFDPDVFEFEKEFGYKHDGYVYIYKGKVKKHEILEPGCVYLDENKQPVWVAHSEDTIDLYDEKRCIPLNNDQIYEELLDKSKFKEIDPVLLESADDYFAPTINENDDILKVIIKKVLQEKKVSIKATKTEINAYDITNMKSALIKPNKMSFRYFIKWCETLDIKCSIMVWFQDAEGYTTNLSEDL